MGGGRHRKADTYAKSIRSQHFATKAHDRLALFEQLMEELGPKLVKDLSDKKLDDRELMEKYKKYAAARLVFNALGSDDVGKSSAAANSILDRTTGKPIEKREITDKRDTLSTEELKALAKSKLTKMLADEKDG